ncbi:fanconi-associated nuclease 1-like isoform X2 [Euwallacea similis]
MSLFSGEENKLNLPPPESSRPQYAAKQHGSKFVTDENKQSCSKTFSAGESSGGSCNAVASDQQNFSLPGSSKTSFSRKPNESKNINPVFLNAFKEQVSAIPNSLTKKKGSKKCTDSSNLSDPSGIDYTMKDSKTKKNKEMQRNKLNQFDKLIEMVLNNIHLKKLLNEEELKKISEYKSMKSDKKFLLLMIYSLSNHWYNLYTFCTEVQFYADEKEISDIFKELHKERLVEYINYQNLDYDLKDLLKTLSNDQLKNIMNKLPLEENRKRKLTKSDRVDILNEKFNSRNELKHLAMQAIKTVLGTAIRLTQPMYDLFNYLYFLATFTNPEFSDINQYFKHVIDENGEFPTAPIEDCIVFNTRTEFTDYVAAVQLQLKLNGEKNNIEISMIANKAYQELSPHRPRIAYENFPHIQQFTSTQVYCSILSKCCKLGFESSNYENDNLLKWLEFLLNTFKETRKMGTWLRQFIEILKRKKDMTNATVILIRELFKRKDFFKETDFHLLGELGRCLGNHARQNGNIFDHDSIIKLIPRRIDLSLFQRIFIDMTENESKSQIKNEIVSHYSGEGYSKYQEGGPVLKALLVIYFWDIIYNPETVIPYTFISKLQFAPLDMYTFDGIKKCSRFYGERKKFIDQRIREIERSWSEQYLIKFGKTNYQDHSHEFSAAGIIMNIINDVGTIELLVSIIGRQILAKIFERLIKDFDQYQKGMPDFLFWDINKRTYKFVVSSTKESLNMLPIAQNLWLEYLYKNQASAEVCFVRTGGTKKKMKKQSSAATENDST